VTKRDNFSKTHTIFWLHVVYWDVIFVTSNFGIPFINCCCFVSDFSFHQLHKKDSLPFTVYVSTNTDKYYNFHFKKSAPSYRHWGAVQAVWPLEGVEVQLYSFMTTALEGGEESALCPGCSLPLGKTWYPLYRRLGGPQGRSGQVRKISPPPRFDPRTVQPVASPYTDWANRPTCIH
jgi:hypothetical protein